DMLTNGRMLPNVDGPSEPQINAADLKTRGWELTVAWRDQFKLAHKPFHYSARFLLSDSRSWITRFDNPTNYLGGNWDEYYVGRKIGEVWGLETLGFFKDQADIDNSADQWAATSYPGDRPIEPGDLKYKDQNGDGVIDQGSWIVDDPGDYKIIGNTRSRYNFGLDLNGDWNGFDIRFFFQGVGKKDFFPKEYKFSGIYGSPWGIVFENNLDHWAPENPDGYFPRLKSYLDYGGKDMNISQTRFKQNAAYLRMKNITFGYTLPKLMTRKFGVESMRFYFSGENLFEITKLSKNYDPEALNDSSHPFQRTYSLGLNITL
ncbi:MAG: SusC/RagA family TonB-linked outer membrane protein, partial [Tannerellaceae bacterium]|nr:SusC/RagA family TonB-linked outer membrane protein [Tannerellaceae bacterium]